MRAAEETSAEREPDRVGSEACKDGCVIGFLSKFRGGDMTRCPERWRRRQCSIKNECASGPPRGPSACVEVHRCPRLAQGARRGPRVMALVVALLALGAAQVTELHLAAGEGNTTSVLALIAAGADVKAKSHTGETALMWAARMGHTETVEELLAAGADLNATSNGWPEYGMTALTAAARYGHTETALALIAAGADLEGALIAAASSGGVGDPRLETWSRCTGDQCTATATALIAAGADLEAKDRNGMTALHVAARNGHTEVVTALIAAGADLDAKNDDGETALMWAASNGRTEVVTSLIAAGADLDATNGDGESAWAIASVRCTDMGDESAWATAEVAHRQSQCAEVVGALSTAGALPGVGHLPRSKKH